MKDEVAQKILEKVKRDYEYMADEFSESRNAPWPEFEMFKKYIKPGMKVLDLGCGNGRLYKSLKDTGIIYAGIDNCARLIKLAQEQWQTASDPRPTFKTGDILNTKIETNCFDIVFFIAVLHQIPSQKLQLQALNNIHQILKKDGLLIMTNWNLWQKKYKKYVTKNNLKKTISLSKLDFNDALIPWKETKIKRYYHAFTEKELSHLLQESHFKTIENTTTERNIVTIAKKS